jgi:hypothetical protein
MFHPPNNPGPVACFSDKDDVSGNQNNCYWPLHSESIARCKHHYAGEAGILLHIFGKDKKVNKNVIFFFINM